MIRAFETSQLALLYAFLNVQRGGGPTVWESCRAILETRRGQSDVIGVVKAGSYLESRLIAAVDMHHLFLHSPPPSSDNYDPFAPVQRGNAPDSSLVAVGGINSDVFESPVVWPASPGAPCARKRTIDFLYCRSHQPGFIVVETGACAYEILSGARETLRTHRPQVLVNLSDVPQPLRYPELERLVDMLDLVDYKWFDGLLLPCPSPERRHQIVVDQGAQTFCAFAAPALLADDFSQSDAIAAVFSSMSQRDWVPAVSCDALRTGPIAVPFDDNILAYGLYPAETDGADTWWRWSGPSSHIRLVLPIPCAGRWEVALTVFNLGVAERLSNLRAYFAGMRLDSRTVGEFECRFGPLAVPHAERVPLCIDIVTPQTRRASADDPRKIGVCFSELKLYRS